MSKIFNLGIACLKFIKNNYYYLYANEIKKEVENRKMS